MNVTIEIPDDLAWELRLMGRNQAVEYNTTHTDTRQKMLRLQGMGLVSIHVGEQKQNITFFRAYLTDHGQIMQEIVRKQYATESQDNSN